MTPSTLRQARAEALRFIERADKCIAGTRKVDSYEYLEVGKETGALRRASMDLTRKLAELRGGK